MTEDEIIKAFEMLNIHPQDYPSYSAALEFGESLSSQQNLLLTKNINITFDNITFQEEKNTDA